jgi:hypothetical protein
MTDSPAAVKFPNFIDPRNITVFAGGEEVLYEAASSFLPGSAAWKRTMISEVRLRAAKNLTHHLNQALEAQVALHNMIYRPRPDDETKVAAWDDAFASALFAFLRPHFSWVYPAVETRDESMENWLAQHCPDPIALVFDAEVRLKIAQTIAESAVNNILALREKEGQILSMIGIVADNKNWPKPMTEDELEEAQAFLDAKAASSKKAAKSRQRRVDKDDIHFSGIFVDNLRVAFGKPMREMSILLGVPIHNITQALNGVTTGVHVKRQTAANILQQLIEHREHVEGCGAAIFTTLSSLTPVENG